MPYARSAKTVAHYGQCKHIVHDSQQVKPAEAAIPAAKQAICGFAETSRRQRLRGRSGTAHRVEQARVGDLNAQARGRAAQPSRQGGWAAQATRGPAMRLK